MAEQESSANNVPYAELKVDIAQLKDLINKKKTKDAWDIAALVSQFISAVILAAIGLWWNQHTQVQLAHLATDTQKQLADLSNKAAENQLNAARQDRLLKYLESIANAHDDDKKRALLIASAELAIPDQATLIAQYYAATDPSDQVRLAAIDVLGKQQSVAALKSIMATKRLPDADAAEKALGIHVREVRLRMSEIDDFADALVNGKIAVAHSPRDSGWQDITKLLHPGTNEILFKLFNGPAGGYGGRFQVLAGGNVYDSGSISKNECPCNKEAMEIKLTIEIDKDGVVTQMGAAEVTFLPA